MATLYPIVEVVDADGAPVTGDAANLTLTVVTDGTAAAYSGSITEVADGQYKVGVTQSGTLQGVSGVSATSGAIVVAARWMNPGTAGASAVTLYVKDGSSNPIAGASVTVPGAGTLTTSALGAVTFNLDDATYAVTVRSSASYTPAASYSVVVSSGAVTSPAGGILTVTAISLPDPASSECYALYNTETDENNVRFGASGVTVQVIDMTAAGKVDAVNGICRAIKGSTRNTDADGQWSMDIPIQAFTAGASLTLRRSWVDAAGETQSDDWSAVLVAPDSGTQVCWASLSPSRA